MLPLHYRTIENNRQTVRCGVHTVEGDIQL